MQAVSDHKFASLADAKAYALAGNATMTLQSLKTGAHFTYKIRQAKDRQTQQPVAGTYFVSLLRNGSADEGDFTYLGLVRDGRFQLTAKSAAGADAPSVKAFSYFWALRDLPGNLVVRHEGRCGRCGRTLTHPESINAGIGPECAQIMEGGAL